MYRTILCAAAALFVASQAEAQTPPLLRDKVIGTWRLISWESVRANG
jgi:hypothetical protein